MNWLIGIGAVVVVLFILKAQNDDIPQAHQADPHIRSTMDALAPLTAGGKTSAAGPSVDPTGVSVFITYDKV